MRPSKEFRKECDAIMADAAKKISVVLADEDRQLEDLAVRLFGPVEKCVDDGFGPPADAVRVECWHCGEKYNSNEMKRAYRPRFQAAITETVGRGFPRLDPLWWCKNDDCDGAGFGHDIHAVKPRKQKALPSKAKDRGASLDMEAANV